ncbi:unnamed protein product, partial [Ilex paraguariensis]
MDPTLAPWSDTALLLEAATAPAPAPIDVEPAPQGYTSTVHTDAALPSRSADSFSTSIDELFGDIEHQWE